MGEVYDLTQRRSGASSRFVQINGGLDDEWALQHTSMAVAQEYTTSCTERPSFAKNYPRDRFIAIVHTVPNATVMRREVDHCIELGFGDFGLVTDYNEAIPPYW